MNPEIQTIVILDWDDTLLPSSYLIHLGYISKEGHIYYDSTTNTEISNQFKKLEKLIIKFIQSISHISSFYIVTNAQQGWVQLSMKAFFPNLSLLIPDCQIISAREIYKTSNTSIDPIINLNYLLMWKLSAFKVIKLIGMVRR